MARRIGAYIIAGVMASAISACGEDKGPSYTPDLRPISCAVGHAGKLSQTCTFERAFTGDEALVILHDEQGGLRRFSYNPDSKTLSAADGADTAISHYDARNMRVELRVAGNVYHIPIAYLMDGDEDAARAEKGG